MDIIINDTIVCLKQGVQLMAKLSQELYVRTHTSCYDSTIGGHVRHNLYHFISFQTGVPTGQVDYDARLRDELLESDPDYASGKMTNLITFLESLEPQQLADTLKVKMDSGAAHEESPIWSDSSVQRELQFLISHTIHHYALIATLCANEGMDLPKDFGVAPSTLRFRKSQNAQCAR